MISVAVYRVLHFGGIFLIMMSLGAMCLRALAGGGRDFPQRKWLGMFHGIGLLLAFVAGFGMIARLGLEWRGWLFGKLAIWLVLAAAPALIYRKPGPAKIYWLAIAGLGFVAAWLAGSKPF